VRARASVEAAVPTVRLDVRRGWEGRTYKFVPASWMDLLSPGWVYVQSTFALPSLHATSTVGASFAGLRTPRHFALSAPSGSIWARARTDLGAELDGPCAREERERGDEGEGGREAGHGGCGGRDGWARTCQTAGRAHLSCAGVCAVIRGRSGDA
jgi:hypothetical protein